MARPVAALGPPSLPGPSGGGVAAAAVLIAARSIGAAELGGRARVGLRTRAWPTTASVLAALVIVIAVLDVALDLFIRKGVSVPWLEGSIRWTIFSR